MTAASRPALRTWEAASPHGVVVLRPGPTENLDLAARQLTEARYRVVAQDHRGDRDAGDPRGQTEVRRAVADLSDVIDAEAERPPGLPVFLLGHGTGAGVALRTALARQARLAGLILAAPLVQAPQGRLASVLERMGGALLPDAAPMTLDPQEAARDSRTLADWFADPLIRVGPGGLSSASARARRAAAATEGFAPITLATLLLWGVHEGLHPPGGAEQLLGALPNADLTRHSFDVLYDQILEGPERGSVLEVVGAWLGDHV